MHTDGKLLLSIRNLTKRYGDKTILESLNLDLHKGEVVVILGPSGSGKSTLLRCVNGLEEKQGGSIVMDGAGEGSDFESEGECFEWHGGDESAFAVEGEGGAFVCW